jgi:glycosyltransferase involved in cell wall biosynthesis
MSDVLFFSVVIPTYNRVSKLIPTVTTILSQKFRAFEIIIVDDGSTDGTAGIIAEKFSDERIRVISQPNSERGAARNNGLRNAKGEYVVFFDSDDIMHDDHLQILHENILAENRPDFIATKFDFTDEHMHHRTSDMHSLSQGYYDYRLFLNGNCLACNVCVKRELKGLISFEEDRKYAIKEDWLFLISNMKNHKLYIVDKVTISMLDHQDRSMRSDNELIISRTLLAMVWILDRLDLSPREKNKLIAHVNYFCAIHWYLEDHRRGAISYAKNAIKFGGLKMKYLILIAKSILGRKFISQFR